MNPPPQPALRLPIPPLFKEKDDLVFNPELDCFVDREGKCFYADLDETTLEPIPNKSRIVGKLRPGVNGEQAQESNFIAAKANSRKRKNRRNRTRKN